MAMNCFLAIGFFMHIETTRLPSDFSNSRPKNHFYNNLSRTTRHRFL